MNRETPCAVKLLVYDNRRSLKEEDMIGVDGESKALTDRSVDEEPKIKTYSKVFWGRNRP